MPGARAELVALHLGAHEHSVFVMSTGVIGVQLPMAKIEAGVPKLVDATRARRLARCGHGHHDHRHAAQAGDAHGAGGRPPGTLHGHRQGCGHDPPQHGDHAQRHRHRRLGQRSRCCRQALLSAVNVSFNRISIDGDTSTNDTVLLLANGLADNEEIVETPAASCTLPSWPC